MLRALYLVCSESGVIDRYSNSVSAFNIIEAVQIYAEGAPEANDTPGVPSLPHLSLRVTATWISDEDDRKHEHEHETRAFSDAKGWKVLHSGKFRWTTKNHRFTVHVQKFAPEPGVCVIQHAIRRVGESDWHTQQYEIEVEGSSVSANAN